MVSQDRARKGASLRPQTLQESNLCARLPCTPTPYLTPGENCFTYPINDVMLSFISAESHDALREDKTFRSMTN